jgi:hypothetical protein
LSPLALFIASQLRLANDYARDSAVLADLGSRNAATLLFQAVEAALLAVLTVRDWIKAIVPHTISSAS